MNNFGSKKMKFCQNIKKDNCYLINIISHLCISFYEIYKIQATPQASNMEDPIQPTSIAAHMVTLLLIYAYIKEELTFPFVYTLTPSLFVIGVMGYHYLRVHRGLKRAKFIITGMILTIFVLTLQKAIKDEGGMHGDMDDDKWIVRHRKCFSLLILAGFVYSALSFIDPEKSKTNSLFKEVLLNIFSSLSMPLTICSGGACNSIYISTITSILSSFSLPLTMVVPILNILGYLLQFLGLFSLYSVNKWRSYPFWIYFLGMVCQWTINAWLGIILMISGVVINAKMSHFVYGKKIFKESII